MRRRPCLLCIACGVISLAAIAVAVLSLIGGPTAAWLPGEIRRSDAPPVNGVDMLALLLLVPAAFGVRRLWFEIELWRAEREVARRSRL